MILAIIFKLYVYSHNTYIFIPIFSGNILCLVLNIIYSHFLLYLQVMDSIGNKPSGFMGYPSHELFLNLTILFNVMFLWYFLFKCMCLIFAWIKMNEWNELLKVRSHGTIFHSIFTWYFTSDPRQSIFRFLWQSNLPPLGQVVCRLHDLLAIS